MSHLLRLIAVKDIGGLDNNLNRIMLFKKPQLLTLIIIHPIIGKKYLRKGMK